MKSFTYLFAIILAPCFTNAQERTCEAVVLRDVHAIQNPSAIMKAGERLNVTQYTIFKKTGVKTFCAHGDYCYERYVTVDGKKVEAMRLTTNCRILQRVEYADEEEIIYRVVPTGRR